LKKAALIILLLVMVFLPLPARASGPPAVKLSYTSVYQFETDIDQGGSFAVDRHMLRLDFTRFMTRQTGIGLGLHYDLENWDFNNLGSVGGASPWREIHRPTLNLSLFHAPSKDWKFFIASSVGLARTPGAKSSDSQVYGAVFSAMKSINPNLDLGLGLGAFKGLDEIRAFPFVAISWKINEQWQLKNPFSAGPAGPAGLELVWNPRSPWEMGVGGAWRSYRFRLSEEGSVPGGIGETEFIAAYLRLGRTISQRFSFDISGGGLFSGRLNIENSAGTDLGNSDFATAPFLGLTFKGQF